MANPTLKVEIAFASDPLDDTPTFVDVSAYVRQADGVTIRRGNLTNDPQGHDSAGFFSFTLDDRDRRFDWTYATGPYFGQLTPRKQVRISGVSGSDYPLIYGWTTGFRCESRAMGKDAVTVVEGYDALGMLAGKRLTGDPLADYVNALSPLCWLRQADANGIADAVGSYPAHSGGVPALRTTNLVPSLKSAGVVADGVGWAELSPKPSSTGGWSVSMWVRSSTDTQGPPFWGDVTSPQNVYAECRTRSSTGRFYFYGKSEGGTHSITVDGDRDDLNDGGAHHVVLTSSSATIYNLYVDGAEDAAIDVTVAGNGSATVAIQTVLARYGWDAITLAVTPPIAPSGILRSGVVQDLAFFDSVLSAAEVQEIYNRSIGIIQETTAARFTRLLDEADWPTAWRNVSTAPRGECGPIVFNGQSILTGLQQVERTEQGRLYAALDGKVTFRHRYYAYEDTASNTAQITLSDDGSNQGYRTFGHRRGDEDVVNDITVTNGTIQSRSTNAASQTSYDTNANTVDTVLSTYSQIDQMSDGLIFLYKDARIRLDPIEVQNNAASWPDLLSLELADRVRIESTPMGVGSQMVEEVLVESVQWNISDQGWKFTVSGSPVPPDPIDVGFWSLDVSQLDSGTALAY